MPIPTSFQSEHSPRGAAGAFAIGEIGFGGGFSHRSGTCGNQDLYLGYAQDGVITALPYCSQGEQALATGMAEFVPTGDPESEKFPAMDIRFIDATAIGRHYGLGIDRISSERLQLELASPVTGIPEPEQGQAAFADAICPAIVARLHFDNTAGSSVMTGFFAIDGLPGFCQMDTLTGGDLVGIETLDGYGFACAAGKGIAAFSDLYLDNAFRRPKPVRNYQCRIGGITVQIPAGEKRCLNLALGWYHAGPATIGKRTVYAYTRHFGDLAQVCQHALRRSSDWFAIAEGHNQALAASPLNTDRRFLLAKAIRSYWGNSELVAEGDQLRWIQNEGSCNMINTLDLTVDMAFFEARAHPWLLRNVLDSFVAEYSYHDQVHAPGQADQLFPGGLSFTHEQGYRNAFSPPGFSQYETTDHPACFSYMTCEELLNWILCAGIYVHATDDQTWLRQVQGTLNDCLVSLLNRDHHQPAKRRGVMQFDSSRCGAEAEITTYDSLDPSLGQARNNTYIATKYWAATLALAELFRRLGDDARQVEADASATRSATTIIQAWNDGLGYIPALLEDDDRSAIIPIIEPLVYPLETGLQAKLTENPELIRVLGQHLQAVLQEGRCRFADGGWKLSGNNDNSWMSKIAICQHVAERVLGHSDQARADTAHAHWWHTGSVSQSVIDQVVAGRSPGRGSTYPRTASMALWWPEMDWR